MRPIVTRNMGVPHRLLPRGKRAGLHTWAYSQSPQSSSSAPPPGPAVESRAAAPRPDPLSRGFSVIGST
eukprot:CAMPEP_0185555948 /NCGR_PEP_ID=MMETSP1381-20130426/45832_1 /TAXON_ID=298111 /ORGANISM="Pavlova sp., Strain CCMP459" /LENGTH=68 /DNA_ID=CAMNT_0028169293 /DNA_START=67 /DNA_END=273 /DNA_ORIENTATION=+